MFKTTRRKTRKFVYALLALVLLIAPVFSTVQANAEDISMIPGKLIVDYVDINSGATLAPQATVNFEDMNEIYNQWSESTYWEAVVPIPSVSGMINVAVQRAVAVHEGGEGEGAGALIGYRWEDYPLAENGEVVYFSDASDAWHLRILYDSASSMITSDPGYGGVSFLFLAYEDYDPVQVAPIVRYLYADGDTSYSVTPPVVQGKAPVEIIEYQLSDGWEPYDVYHNFHEMEAYAQDVFDWAGGDVNESGGDLVDRGSSFPYAGDVSEGSFKVYLVKYETATETDPNGNPNIMNFNSVLLVDENSNVPNLTVNNSIAAGTGIAGSDVNKEIVSPSAETGVTGTPTIGSAVFSSSDATVTTLTGVTIPAGKKAVAKNIAVDFTNVTFERPGIFRYVVSEQLATPYDGFDYDVQIVNETNGSLGQRVIDVYVTRNGNDEFEISGMVMHEVAGNVAQDLETYPDKSSGFVNSYGTIDLQLVSKTYGNQAAREKYFAYTITIASPDGSEFTVPVDWSAASTSPDPGYASDYTAAEMAAANTSPWASNDSGVITHTVYLKEDQSITIHGIPVGATYSVTSVPEDYYPAWGIGPMATAVPETSGTTAGTGNNTMDVSTRVEFVMSREGDVPTGIALSIIPGVALIAGAVAAFATVRKRKNDQETV